MNNHQIKDTITKHGWLCQHVSPMPWQRGELPFSYSIGFYEKYNQPEILVIGYEGEIAYGFLHSCYLIIQSGQNLEAETRTNNILQNEYQVIFKEIRKELYEEHLGIAVNYYGHTNFPAYVLIWPDAKNKFPWEQGYDDISQEQELRLV